MNNSTIITNKRTKKHKKNKDVFYNAKKTDECKIVYSSILSLHHQTFSFDNIVFVNY